MMKLASKFMPPPPSATTSKSIVRSMQTATRLLSGRISRSIVKLVQTATRLPSATTSRLTMKSVRTAMQLPNGRTSKSTARLVQTAMQLPSGRTSRSMAKSVSIATWHSNCSIGYLFLDCGLIYASVKNLVAVSVVVACCGALGGLPACVYRQSSSPEAVVNLMIMHLYTSAWYPVAVLKSFDSNALESIVVSNYPVAPR
jgi:hypothetical protein